MTEILIAGTARTTVLANLRVGAPTTQAPVGQKLPAGSSVIVAAIASGEAVEGNSLWLRTSEHGFVWSGACGPLQAADAPIAAPATPPPISAGFPSPVVID